MEIPEASCGYDPAYYNNYRKSIPKKYKRQIPAIQDEDKPAVQPEESSVSAKTTTSTKERFEALQKRKAEKEANKREASEE